MRNIMEEQNQQKRQVALKVEIQDILNGKYVKEEGWLPNYIQMGNKKISRANIIGVIVSKDTGEENVSNFVIDDGTGRLPLRFFDGQPNVIIGDIVNIVGRPREFGTDRYIVPELLRKIDQGWVKYRKYELSLNKTETNIEETQDIVEETQPEDGNIAVKLIDAIKEIDSGNGASYEEISECAKMEGIEDNLQKLLESGDIFEVKPGRYKVLE